MAGIKGIVELTETIFNESGMALDESFTEPVRRLGDSTFKAGIKAAISYLSGKSELLDEDIDKLSAGTIPEDYEQQHFEQHISGLNEQLNEKDEDFCHEAFISGISTALLYLTKAAKLKDVDLLSIIPSDVT